MTLKEAEQEFAKLNDLGAVEDDYQARVLRQYLLRADGKTNQYEHDLYQAVQIGYCNMARKACREALRWNEKRFQERSGFAVLSLTVLHLVDAAVLEGFTEEQILKSLERRVVNAEREVPRSVKRFGNA